MESLSGRVCHRTESTLEISSRFGNAPIVYSFIFFKISGCILRQNGWHRGLIVYSPREFLMGFSGFFYLKIYLLEASLCTEAIFATT